MGKELEYSKIKKTQRLKNGNLSRNKDGGDEFQSAKLSTASLACFNLEKKKEMLRREGEVALRFQVRFI